MSELRQDLISGDWVIVAPGRGTRPQFLEAKAKPRKSTPKSACPFEVAALKKTGQWPPIFAYPDETNLRVGVFPNKYPALAQHGKECSVLFHEGIYSARTGVGEHYLIITRDHKKNFAELTPSMATEVFKIFQKLCGDAVKDPCTEYAAPFFNWGPTAGASVAHPHYQFLSIPVTPAHTARSLQGAKKYYEKNHRCAQCDIIAFERKEKKRIIAENNEAIAFIPFASKFAFEIRIAPKKHSSYFYKASPGGSDAVASLLQTCLRSVKKYLKDPDLNVFVHEAPVDGKEHPYHHWHAEIVPHVATPAGFELSTGIYIKTVVPEEAAKILRGK